MEETGWSNIIGENLWGDAFSLFGSITLILLILFCGLLFIQGIRSLIVYKETQPILVAGSLAGIFGLGLTGFWGNALANPGIAILAAAFCAMAAAGGEYDEEFEEVEPTS